MENRRKTPFAGILNEGFTLLEVIIAMAIMVITFSSILAVEGGSINATARAKQMNIVAMLARNQMVETELDNEGKSFDEVPKEAQGVFKPPYEDYRWTKKIREIKFPKLEAIFGGGNKSSDKSGSSSSSKSSGADQFTDLIIRLVSKFLSKSLREVNITVYWKRGTGEQQYVLSTYWVDMNHEFSLEE